ncbi:unnamed protein product [Microthlaspi erraticum]|uniref:Uncharacterized protein n=1 Tax=Microthlaspi erraticum TaxID=1685480 RepID=A0A6D2JXT4_9BRAS|nr:unnamed protein product [Microthlaspi erraticum]
MGKRGEVLLGHQGRANYEHSSLWSFGAFWSIWDVRSMEGLGMDAAQLDTQRKKEEAILKTSSTILNSTGQASTRSS